MQLDDDQEPGTLAVASYEHPPEVSIVLASPTDIIVPDVANPIASLARKNTAH